MAPSPFWAKGYQADSRAHGADPGVSDPFKTLQKQWIFLPERAAPRGRPQLSAHGSMRLGGGPREGTWTPVDTLAIPATCSLCWAGERTRAGLWGETLGQALCKALPADRWASGLAATWGQEEGPGTRPKGLTTQEARRG